MPHPPSRRSRNPRDKTHGRLVLGVVRPQELRRVFFRGASDLADHDDAVGFFVCEEDFQAVDEVGSGKGVAADPDDERLAETGLRGLVDGFVGQGAGAGDDPYAAALVDEAGHDADFALAGGDDAWAVGADESCSALGFEDVGYADHV